MSKLLFFTWFILASTCFVYSYGFVDLNLTLSNNPLIFNFVTRMQQLVYFDRDLSLKVFIGLILLMFMLYLTTLKHQFARFPWVAVSVLAIIFSLAYPMLSSDVFKYLFAAKEILVYHANPYLVTPNSFEGDTWLRFMRWVHTTMPYGPVFIASTIPYYILGLGKFTLVLYLFKLDQVAWYLLTIYLLGKLKGIKAQLFFALNPLVLMEWLTNAHNDAMMIALLMAAIYLVSIKERVWAFVTLMLSIGVKYVTVIFLPFIFLKKFKLQAVISFLLLGLFLSPLLYHYSWQYQPWYVTWLIPLAAMHENRVVRSGVLVYSLSVFSRYLYFVGTGSWLGTPLWHALMTFAPVILILVYNGIHAVVSSAKKT